MKISELGEFGLIDLLSGIVPQDGAGRRLLIGIGDDAAAWKADGATILGTTDALVEGVHFAPDMPWRELGWKALAVNLSDIAAMGGIPEYALVNLSLPGETPVEAVTELYRGMADLARRQNVGIPGGNITGAPLIMISVAVIGRALQEGMLRRCAARPGDLVAVTGFPGSAAGGLKAWTERKPKSGIPAALAKAFLTPQPRVAEAQDLVRMGVLAGIDISDGLMSDLGHVCEASGVGAQISADLLPVSAELRHEFGEEAVKLALAGGEDYELLFTASEAVMDKARASLDPRCRVTVIGRVTRGTGVTLLGQDGKPYHIDERGWNHFRLRGL